MSKSIPKLDFYSTMVILTKKEGLWRWTIRQYWMIV